MKVSQIATELESMLGGFIRDITPSLKMYVAYVKAFGLDPNLYLPYVGYGVDKQLAAGASFDQACSNVASSIATRVAELVSAVIEHEASEHGTKDLALLDDRDYLACLSNALSYVRLYFGYEVDEDDLDPEKFTVDVKYFDLIDRVYSGYPQDMIDNAAADLDLDEVALVNVIIDTYTSAID